MPKSVRIPYELFADISEYFSLPFPESDICRYLRIQEGVNAKAEAMKRHELYTSYKSEAEQEKKNSARLDYLDRVGMSQDYRWSDPCWSPWRRNDK